MQTVDILLMLIALFLGTQINRFLPLFLPQKFLTNPILQKLNQMLPLVIMVLLVLTSLTFPKQGENYQLLFAQLGAILVVLISYRYLKNILLSVGLGILSLNLLLSII